MDARPPRRAAPATSGRLIRGRGLRRSTDAALAPEFGLCLLSKAPPPMPWPTRWVQWPDWRSPSDDAQAREALLEAWRCSETERVEVACRGGRGRTGTALACLAVLDGVAPTDAVRFVREGHHPRAVETRWQRRYVEAFS